MDLYIRASMGGAGLSRSELGSLWLHLLPTVGSVGTVFVTLFGTAVERASCKSTHVALLWRVPHHFDICCSGGGCLSCFCGSELLGRAIYS